MSVILAGLRSTQGRRLAVEQRTTASFSVRLIATVFSVIGSLVVGAVLLLLLGEDPLSTYREMFESSFGNARVFSQTLVSAAPVILTAEAAAIAYRMRLYTIGQDGQLVLGAIATTGVALWIGPELPGLPMITIVLVAGALGGALWALVPALSRAYLGTNEVLSTLMMNFIAFGIMSYLILGSSSFWRDTESVTPIGATIPSQAVLPDIFERADAGIVIAVVVALLLAGAVRFTRWGFELRVVGDSVDAARYAGINVARHVAGVLCLSGALAGLAGAIQVTSVTQSLDPAGLNPGLGIGYTGIVVAALSRLSLVASIPVAIVMAGLLNAGPALQLIGIPSALVFVLQGTILLFVAASQFLLSYRVRRAAVEPAP